MSDSKDLLTDLESFEIPMASRAEDLQEAFSSLESIGHPVTPELREFCETVWAGEIPQRMPLQLVERDFGASLAHAMLSPVLQRRGYFARATKYFVDLLRVYKLGVVLDPFAGSGYMVKALREAGIPTIATDDYSWGYQGPAEKLDALASLKKYGDQVDTVLISWVPPGDEIDFQLWEMIQKDFPHLNVLVISEGMNGCTGSNRFAEIHQFWELVETYETSYGLYDVCAFYPALENELSE